MRPAFLILTMLIFCSRWPRRSGLPIAQVNAYEEINRLKEQLARENVYLAEELKATQDFGIVVGGSQAFEQVLALARQAAPTSRRSW